MQPKIYSIDEHAIPPEKIDQHAYYVIHKLRAAGYEAFLVGGSVRDLLLQKRPKDFDISTSAKPEEIKAVFRNCILIGKRFRLAHVRFGRKIIEVATFRSGDIEDSTLVVRDNDWGTAEEDVLRRDFTINGLFYDPETQKIIDYVGGYPDVQKKILRTIGQPEIRFRQDPVRMIRLLKFRARFDLAVDPHTEEALQKCKEDITKSSQARILEELLRMLESGASEPFIRYMTDHGLLDLLMPQLAMYIRKKPEETYALLQQIDQEIQEESLDRAVLMACLVYPLLSDRIQLKAKEDNRYPHLGIIANEATYSIDRIFQPFFQIPRRLRGAMVSLLSSQFRFTPLQERSKRRLRIPRDPFFPLSLRFFKIRAALNPALQPTYSQWKEAMTQAPHPHRRRHHAERQKN